jgi:hypothetical protein
VLKGLQTYINSFRDEENVYYLSKAGRERVGAKEAFTKNSSYKHLLMRNDIQIHYGMPVQWKNEIKYPLGDTVFIPDAGFAHNGKQYFLEVDHLQKMNANAHKYQCYLQLREQWGQGFPTLIWYTETELRRNQLAELNPGLSVLIYTKKDLR